MQKPPGLERDEAEHAALEAAFHMMPAGYKPRTHLWHEGQPAYINRLIHEGSPYLLQHAHNPVDWWPWGEEALAAAKRQDKPIFLSAGYATCHWCHVMEEESFDNAIVAEALNRDYIPVKLDREQRPDIDQIYVLATTLQHRHAGWPNSVWLFADGRPFHTGTYFQRPHFLQLLEAIATAWKGEGRTELDAFATNLAEGVRRASARAEPPAELKGAPKAAIDHLKQLFNREHGGFSTGTQFPHEGYLLFLMDHWRRTGENDALDMALKSLDEMIAGGLYDQIGGGFHRYTVDVNWRTPHFEKMLYNQALMLQCLTQAWHITGAAHYQRAAERLVAYLKRDMTAPDGAFYTAEDADSLDAEGNREEGAFYCWSPEQARAALGDDAGYAIDALNLTAPPTLEAGPVPHLTPGATPDLAKLDPLLDHLRKARASRPRPIRDDKIIAGWNGLMIRALAEAGQTFGRPEWIAQAARAFDNVAALLLQGTTLARLHARGAAREAGNLSDYTWLAEAALALTEAGEARFLPQAETLTDALLEGFTTGDRLALTPEGPLGPVLEGEDGATPSAESSALALLARLETLKPSPERRAKARTLRTALSGTIAALPIIRLPGLQGALDLDEGPTSPTRNIAEGTARISLHRTRSGHTLEITCATGWHLGGTALPEGQSPVTLTGATVDLPTFSPPEHRLTLPLTGLSTILTVTVQPCSDTICQAPDTQTFRIRP